MKNYKTQNIVKTSLPSTLLIGLFIIFGSCKKETELPQNNNTGVTSIQQGLNNGKTPLQLFQDGNSLSEIYCNNYAGGIIFYLDTMTGEGLVCTLTDIGDNLKWDPNGSLVGTNPFTYLACTDTALWSGSQNTSNVAALRPNSACAFAQNLSNNGYDDWFLPSKAETRIMFNVLGVNGCNKLTKSGNIYWTSSESDQNNAWRLINNSGFGLDDYTKDYPGIIRPVRKFMQ